MKKILIKIFVFILPILLLAYPLDFLISTQLEKSNRFSGEFSVWRDIYAGNINSKILIYGSSRAWVHINPYHIEQKLNTSCYNLGLDASSFYLQYLRHLEYIENNKHPNMIIMSLDIFSFIGKKNLYNYQQYMPYIWKQNIRNYTKTYNVFDAYDYNMPLIRYLGEKKVFKALFNVLKKNNDSKATVRQKGFMGVNKNWNDDLKKATEAQKIYRVNFDNELFELFKEFLNYCKKQNIEMIFVYSPEYIEGQKYVANRDSILNLFVNVATISDIPFLDYSNDSICYNKELFYNTLHLNKEGADIFSRKLSNDLLDYIKK